MNRLDQNIENKIVVLAEHVHGGSVEERKFLCERGFGCLPFTHGSTITGIKLSNEQVMTICGMTDIECLYVPKVEGSAEPEKPAPEVAEKVAEEQPKVAETDTKPQKESETDVKKQEPAKPAEPEVKKHEEAQELPQQDEAEILAYEMMDLPDAELSKKIKALYKKDQALANRVSALVEDYRGKTAD